MTPILISQEQSLERLASILKKTNADCLVVGAGSVPLKDLLKYYNGLKEVIWVVPKSSRHLDWNETHEKQGGKTEVTAWHELVDGEGSFASSELPPNDSVPKVANVTLVSPPSDLPNDVEIIEFTQKVGRQYLAFKDLSKVFWLILTLLESRSSHVSPAGRSSIRPPSIREGHTAAIGATNIKPSPDRDAGSAILKRQHRSDERHWTRSKVCDGLQWLANSEPHRRGRQPDTSLRLRRRQ